MDAHAGPSDAAGGGDSADQATAEKAKAPTQEAAPAKKAIKFDPSTLAGEALKIALCHLPLRCRRRSNAGCSPVSDMVKNRDISMDIENKDQIAVRTGVVLADLVLTVNTATDEEQVARLGRIKAGMAALGAGAEVASTLDELSAKIKSGSGQRRTAQGVR